MKMGKYRTACMRVKAVRDFVSRETNNNLCKCGCGKYIDIKPEHYYEGIPSFVRGHGQRYTLADNIATFWSMVDKTDGCWIWTGGVACSHGYGAINVGGKPRLCHRFSYEIHYGSIPEGKFVLHKCDNTMCVKPDHLFLGSHLDNMLDKTLKGRSAVKLTPDDVFNILWLVMEGFSDSAIAKLYKVVSESVRSIRIGRRWNWLTGLVEDYHYGK